METILDFIAVVEIMKKLSNIKLHLVITLFPPDMGDHFYKGPQQDGDYGNFWKKVMEHYGMENLEPIEKGSNHVRTIDIDDASLKAFIKLQLMRKLDTTFDKINSEIETLILENKGEEYEKERIFYSVDGGVALFREKEILITPQCCYSMHDYKEWTSIEPTNDFRMIWIGHPWLYYKTKGEVFYLTGLIEKSFQGEWKYYDSDLLSDKAVSSGLDYALKEGKIVEDNDVRYTISYQELREAINGLENEIADFQNRIEQACRDLGLKYPKIIAQGFVHGNGDKSYGEKGVN